MKQIAQLTLTLLVAATFSAEARVFDRAGNGGDPLEMKFHEVAANIRLWIQEREFSELRLPGGITPQIYRAKMLDALSKYNVTFTSDPVLLNGRKKACRNFRDWNDSYQILCNSDRFLSFLDRDRTGELQYVYPLVHHEIAGLAGLESNIEDQSNYYISRQLPSLLSVHYGTWGSLAYVENVENTQAPRAQDDNDELGRDIHKYTVMSVEAYADGDNRLADVLDEFPEIQEKLVLLQSVTQLSETDMGMMRLYGDQGKVLMRLARNEEGQFSDIDRPDFADVIALEELEGTDGTRALAFQIAITSCRTKIGEVEQEEVQEREQEQEQEKENRRRSIERFSKEHSDAPKVCVTVTAELVGLQEVTKERIRFQSQEKEKEQDQGKNQVEEKELRSNEQVKEQHQEQAKEIW